MPRIIVTEGALRGMDRCRRFLHDRAPEAARRAAQAIENALQRLASAPEMGRPFDEMPQLRELVIPFGESGYVALYRLSPADDAVVVLAFRHQKEAGY